MDIDDKNFFYQATIRICGSLDINQIIGRSFQYLQDFIPLDEMWLTLFHQDFGAMRFVATIDVSGGRKMGVSIPLPEDFRTELEKRQLPTKVTIFNRPEIEPLMLKLLRILYRRLDSSVMILPLLPDGVRVGALLTRAEGKDRYSDTHAELLAMLHDPFALAMSNALIHEEVLSLKDMLVDDNQYLSRELRQLTGDEIVGAEGGLKNVMDMVQQVAPRDNPVLLLGETGVGKEVIANAIHYASPRKNGPFIKVNSGAIPESLIDSELFGHEKGAFTGAEAQKRGRFERAQGGTIFLDEIGDLPLQAQIRLLRVIQQKELERVGGTETIHVDTRIIAATHRNLEHMVENNKFREDLWYRLNVFPIIIPPLRQRKADIPALVEYFLHRKAKELNFRKIPPLAPGAIDRLMDYPWKGNVRELENMVERVLIQYSGGSLNLDHSIFPRSGDTPPLSGTNDRLFKLDEMDARYISYVLERTHGKINGRGGAAEILGVHHNTLRCRMDKLGVSYKRKGKSGAIKPAAISS